MPPMLLLVLFCVRIPAAESGCGIVKDVLSVGVRNDVTYVTYTGFSCIYKVTERVAQMIAEDPLMISNDSSKPYGINGLVVNEAWSFLIVGVFDYGYFYKVNVVTEELSPGLTQMC